MSWANIKSRGSGKLRLALVIEGWPDIWVTDPSVTLASWSTLQGRTVHPGLKYDGVQFRERLVPQDAIPEPDSITFRIVSVTKSDEAMQSFSKRGNVIGALSADLSSSGTTLTGVAPGIATSTRYHIGTETILSGPSTPGASITRGQWDTTAQAHNKNYFQSYNPVRIYDHPPTMQGRRVALWVFGEGDDATDLANATCVWRGIVRRPPQLDNDGVTWLINCDHIVSLLQQTVVGHDVEARIVGIYHHEADPIAVEIIVDGTASTTAYIATWHASEADLCDAVNAKFDAAITELSASSKIASLRMRWNRFHNGYEIIMETGGTGADILVFVGSSQIQHAYGDWLNGNGEYIAYNSVTTSTTYTLFFSNAPTVTADFAAGSTREGGKVVEGIVEQPSFPSAALAGPSTVQAFHQFRSASPYDASLSASPYRLYIDTDMSSINGHQVVIDGITTDWPFEVTDAGTQAFGSDTVNYIELSSRFAGAAAAPTAMPFQGYLNEESLIRPIVEYVDDGDLDDLAQQIVDIAVDNANDGVTPFITTADLASTGATVDWETNGLHSEKLQHRTWAFYKTTSLYDILQTELRARAHIMYVDSDAKLDIRPLPAFSPTTTTTKTIGETDIVTPYDGRGAWASWRVLSEGLINSVTIKDGYSSLDDDWEREWVVRHADSIATHKNRGSGDMEIALKSVGVLGPLDLDDVQDISQAYLALLAKDYATVTVEVPFTKFDYLVGDIVKLTHSLLPDGAGSRGVTNRRAVIIGREWNLSGTGFHGRLTLWMLLDEPFGYAPGAIVHSTNNTSGDTWDITCPTSDNFHKTTSTNKDGNVLEHFEAGDKVRVVQRSTASSPTTVTGTVDSVNEGTATITITFDSTWTPGGSSWLLLPAVDTGSNLTAHQELYARVADSAALLADGSLGKEFR